MPHCAPQVVQSAELASVNGWIPVNRNSLETAFPGVYVLGDDRGRKSWFRARELFCGTVAASEGESASPQVVCGKSTSGEGLASPVVLRAVAPRMRELIDWNRLGN